MFGKKKKVEPVEQPEVYDTDTEVEENDVPGEDLPVAAKKVKPAVAQTVKKEHAPKQFVLDKEEMDLCITALMQTDEYKLYKQLQIGMKIQQIIDGYTEVINE